MIAKTAFEPQAQRTPRAANGVLRRACYHRWTSVWSSLGCNDSRAFHAQRHQQWRNEPFILLGGSSATQLEKRKTTDSLGAFDQVFPGHFAQEIKHDVGGGHSVAQVLDTCAVLKQGPMLNVPQQGFTALEDHQLIVQDRFLLSPLFPRLG